MELEFYNKKILTMNKEMSEGEIKIAMLTLNNRYKSLQNEIKQKVNELRQIENEYLKIAKLLKK